MNYDERTDEQTVRDILAGSSEDFAVLVSRYQKYIFNIGRRFYHNEDDALDFAQEVFTRVFSRLSTYKGISPFRFWLFRIAYNAGINGAKYSRQDAVLDETMPVDSGEPDPEKQHIQGEIKKILMEAVEQLPEKYRICVDFYFFYGLSYSEISSITGFPVNTIKSHVFRAKKSLREKLKGTEAEDYYEV